MQMFQVTTSTGRKSLDGEAKTLTVKVLSESRSAAAKAAILNHRAKFDLPTSVQVALGGIEVVQAEVAMVR